MRKQWIGVLAALMVLLCASVASAYSVDVRVEGAAQTLAQAELEMADGATAWDAVAAVLDANGISYDYSYGYLSRVGELAAGTYHPWGGWMFAVNDTSPALGLGDYVLRAGDRIALYYGVFGETVIPQITCTYAEGALSVAVSCAVDIYDADYNYVETQIRPVADAVVTLDGTSRITDADGQASFTLPEGTLATLRVAKEQAGSYPLLLRTEPIRVLCGAPFTAALSMRDGAQGDVFSAVVAPKENAVYNGTATAIFMTMKGQTPGRIYFTSGDLSVQRGAAEFVVTGDLGEADQILFALVSDFDAEKAIAGSDLGLALAPSATIRID